MDMRWRLLSPSDERSVIRKGTCVFIVDAHEDIAYNALHNDRDVRRSVRRTRQLESARASSNCCLVKGMDETAMVGLPEHRSGGTGLVFATVFCEPDEPDVMRQDGLAQLAYYSELAESASGVRIVTTVSELDALIVEWHAAPAAEQRPIGFVLLMEGADPIRDPSELELWVNRGLRIVGPTWRGSRYAGGTGQPGPLTPPGRDLLREMERLGVILDTSHLAEEAFWQSVDTFAGTAIASHSNARAIVNSDRHLTDDMIRALADRDGVIGTVLCNQFLVEGWEPDGVPVSIEAVVRQIDHVCQLVGSARHVGIGSDFDGGFGVESTPDELDSVADISVIGTALARHGYSNEDIASIMGLNWVRVLRRSLPASAHIFQAFSA